MGQLTIHVEHLQGATGDEFRMNLLNRVLISGRSFWFYLGKLFVPYELTFIYERWKIDAGAWWQYVYPVATLATLGTLWRLRRRIGKAPFVAMLHFYVATSMLVLIQILYMMRFAFVTDHWQYFGCMSVIALAAAGIDAAFDFVAKDKQPLKLALCGTLLLALGVLTWRQGRTYQSEETLWRTTITRNPDAFLAYTRLGYILLQKGQLDEATNQLQKALEIQPDYEGIYNNLGYVFLKKGQADEAIEQFRKILESHPNNPGAYYNLGIAFAQKGQVDEAITQYQKALERQPYYADAHYNLGIALAQKGRVDEAIAHYQRALEIQPDDPKVYNNLGIAFAQKGLADQAIAQFRKAVAIQPDNPKVYNNLGNAFLHDGRLDEAIVQFRKAVAIQPDYIDARRNLGLALAQKGLVDEAIAQYQEVLRFKPDDPDAKERLRALGVPVPE
jgi:protein O-mannosyl-transferase